ncbi:MAG: hypothetical protein ACRDUA_04080 [Micromonosporaceae bacterium]
MTSQTTARVGSLREHWPVPAGLGFAALIAFDLPNGADLAAVLAAAAAVYVGAAALRKPSAAWPMFFGTVVVITVMKLLGQGIQATWVLFAGGVVLIVAGWVRDAARPTYGLPLQSLALLGFGAAAIAGTMITPDLGGYVVAAGLFGHAAWDLHHYRGDRVVSRSLAEFCLVLDATLALVLVLVTALT